MDYFKESVFLHEKYKGKLEIKVKTPLETKNDLSLAYSPGVAEPCREIEKNPERSFDLTWRGNTVAVISDGSAVLGLGNIGGTAAMPVMEGKCALFKAFGDVDAFPLCLDTQDTDEIVETIIRLAPSFGGINLEDIAAPQCFEIEKRLREKLNIPVFHDDQHGTAIVTLAALENALKVVNKSPENIRIVISGAGAAGISIARLLIEAGMRDIIMCDSKGIVSPERDDLNSAKRAILTLTNDDPKTGTLQDALNGADVFIGVSKPNLLTAADIETMNSNAIIFALSNPIPEIMPEEAKKGGAAIVATGRSDMPNQVNNVLVFPGLFRGVFDIRAKEITAQMYMVAARALADMVQNPHHENILPQALDKTVAPTIAASIRKMGA